MPRFVILTHTDFCIPVLSEEEVTVWVGVIVQKPDVAYFVRHLILSITPEYTIWFFFIYCILLLAFFHFYRDISSTYLHTVYQALTTVNNINICTRLHQTWERPRLIHTMIKNKYLSRIDAARPLSLTFDGGYRHSWHLQSLRGVEKEHLMTTEYINRSGPGLQPRSFRAHQLTSDQP